MAYRQRLSATVRADLLRAGKTAVREGRAPSLSAWVDEALARQAEHERRFKAFDEFIEAFEAEHGEITDEEVREATRRTRARAIRVRPPSAGARIPPRRRRSKR